MPSRSRELPDDDPEKWRYTEHARAKHAIQRHYLGAWMTILGKNNELLIFDGFAGRGRYTTGEDGSPLIFWRRAVEVADSGRATQIGIRCNELHHNNYANLCAEIAGLTHPKVRISPSRGKFEDEALKVAKSVAASGKRLACFWTADPYGFKGVPFNVVEQLLRLERSEVLITFMVRDMRRFLSEPHHQEPITEFFGGDGWREHINKDGEGRERGLLLTYSKLVRERCGGWATPFRVFEDQRRQTLYYLVHLTRSPLGMRKMKEAMVKQSSDMIFRPLTLRPPDQIELDIGEQAPWPRLQKRLADTYSGRATTFEDLLNADYPEGFWVEPHYREALLDMEKYERVSIRRDRSTPTGRKPTGCKLTDIITFPEQQLTL